MTFRRAIFAVLSTPQRTLRVDGLEFIYAKVWTTRPKASVGKTRRAPGSSHSRFLHRKVHAPVENVIRPVLQPRRIQRGPACGQGIAHGFFLQDRTVECLR